MELEECFNRYNDITLTIIETVESDDYERLDELFEQRQSILDNIKNSNCSKEEMKRIYLKYNIDELEKKIEEEMKKRKEEALDKLKKSQERKVAMNGYNNLQARAVFFSKEF
ncbi:flagellar protein FliT [Clostridium beijerinckii]|uniref:flagellar protein FliT n=1 Tax=Clostridium beijerinckii TaxID=1520 RepID=UPI00080A5A17|nr:flagellar protein FliT [Clostridium beijerinckii]OCA96805.1 hypothetical protein BGS1_06000 [Clostridium beijerinckii]